jgi:predicted permease
MTRDWHALIRAHLPPLGDSHEQEIVDELAQHLADLHAEVAADGGSEADADAAALAVLTAECARLASGVAQARRTLPGVIADRWTSDTPPDRRRWSPLAGLGRDLSHAMRALVHAPGYTAIVLTTLALGVGANSAIFAAVDSLLLRPLPYANADRLVVPVSVNLARGIDDGSISFADYVDWRREAEVFAAVSLWRQIEVDLAGAGDPVRVAAVQTSPEFFQVIAVTPLAGRSLTAADHAAGAPRAAVIAHDLWQRIFGGAADVVGRTVRVGGVPHEIVGVLPPRTVWPERAALFVPLPAQMSTDVRTRRDNMIFQAVARLNDGVPIERGDAVLATIAQRLERDDPGSRKGWSNRLTPIREFMIPAELAQAVWVLLAAVGAVLMIACANLAHLGLVRGLGRSREIGIRVALGASRWRLVRHVGAECLLLAVAGAAAAAAVAWWLIPVLAAMAPDGTPYIEHMSLDWRVLTVTTVLSTIAVGAAGLVPALITARVAPGRVLKEGAPTAGSSRRLRLARRALIVAEVAGAVVLLVGAALLMRSFWRLQHVATGVDVDRVLAARLSLPRSPRYATNALVSGFFQQLTDGLEAVPGVAAAGATSFVPVGGGGFGLGRVFLAEGRPEPPAAPDVSAQWNVVTPRYFETVGLPILQGRAFSNDDRAASTPVIIVSRSFATQMFGDENPIGRRVRSWRDENLLREIVGVTAEVRYWGLDDRETVRQVYVPHTQNSWGFMNIVVRADGNTPAGLEAALRREVAAIDRDLALSNVSTLSDVASASIASERYTALLLTVFAATALAIGAIGIYGVIAHSLLMRRRELGLRAALGASTRQLYRIVWNEGLAVTAIGLGLGVVVAAVLSRSLEALLFETAPHDTAAYAVTIVTVLAVAVLACLGPARRAARVDPLTELRQP